MFVQLVTVFVEILLGGRYLLHRNTSVETRAGRKKTIAWLWLVPLRSVTSNWVSIWCILRSG